MTRNARRLALVWLIVAAVLVGMLAGCAPPRPDLSTTSAAVLKPLAAQIAARPSVEELPAAALAPEAAEMRGLASRAAERAEDCEARARDLKLARWRSLCWWIGVGASILSVAAFFLLLRFVGLKWAWRAAGILGALGSLGFAVAWVLGHLWLVVAILVALAVAAIAVKLLGQWRALTDGAKVLARNASDRMEDFEAALARADIHNVESFGAFLARLKGAPPSP